MSVATAIAFEPDAVWIGTGEGTLVRVAAESIWAMRACPHGAVGALAVSDDGTSLLVADVIGTVSILKTTDGSVLDSFSCPSPVRQGRILSPRTYVTVDNERRGFLWMANGEGPVSPAPICKDGTTPVRFDRFGASGTSLTLLAALRWMSWDLATNHVVAEHRPIDGMQLVYIDGLVGLSASGGHYFIHWDDYLVLSTESEKIIHEGSVVHRAWSAALSDTGRRLAVGTRNGELVVIDDGQTRTLALQPSLHAICDVVWQGDGRRIGWIDVNGGFGVVDATTGRQIIDRAQGAVLLGQG